jgi:hypothetical protein
MDNKEIIKEIKNALLVAIYFAIITLILVYTLQ